MFERYREAVDYLERRLWHELPIMPVERALQGRIRTLLAHFGDPHRKVPVIHVGGSAGKGSVATMIASILRAAGLRTGLYTSPHLQTFIERIDVDGQLIAPHRFAELVLGLDPLVRKMHVEVLDGIGFGRPSLVEVAFAAGMKHFADERCDVAVIEVGLGGRTDCTNVFDDPIPKVTVLTNVEYEHRERLGPAIADIAREKAAIIQGGTVITAARRSDALHVIELRCEDRADELWRVGKEIRVTAVCRDADGTTFDLRTPDASMRRVYVPVAGDHQVENAALAIAAASRFTWGAASNIVMWKSGKVVPSDHPEFVSARFDNIFRIEDENEYRHGLDRVRINARLETVQHSPRVILDGAHNPIEAKATMQAIRDHWLAAAGDGRARPAVHLVVGILADKDQRAMVREFASIASSVVITQPPLVERTASPERMIEAFRKRLPDDAIVFAPSPLRALDMALSRAGEHDIVCVTGSMFLAGALRERWCPERQILERRSSAI